MENSESKLFEAAAKGCITSLLQLLKDDPLILDRVVINCFSENPLHVAAMLGHKDFVEEVIRIKPELTNEFNSHQSSPLHLASAKGHVDVARALLSVDSRACLDRDKNGLTPLHLAAVKGWVEVMKILLQAQPDAAQLRVYRGENILHLCIRGYQLEALKLLVRTIDDSDFVNCKDIDGNTILHLAVADKQVETIKFLSTLATLEVNALNLEGMTAADVLIGSRKDVRDSEIEESLKHAGGIRTLETNITRSSSCLRKNTYNRLLNQQNDWLDKKRNALMVVASLIATMAFQVGVNPPGGMWQDDKLVDSNGNHTALDRPHLAGFSIFAYNSPIGYPRFYIVNTTGFVASLSIIMLLMGGLPLRRRLFMWILMVMTWIAITAIALTYLLSVVMFTPYEVQNSILYVIGYSITVWLCLMALLVIGHTIRLIVKFLKRLRRRKRRRRTMFQVSAVVGDNVAL